MTSKRADPRIEADFVAAIQHLLDNSLSVTFQSVARQAGHSRTLISRESSCYRAVRQRILDVKAEVAPDARSVARPRNAERADLNQKVARLSAEVRELDRRLATAASTMAALLVESMNRGGSSRREASLAQRLAARAKSRAVDGTAPARHASDDRPQA